MRRPRRFLQTLAVELSSELGPACLGPSLSSGCRFLQGPQLQERRGKGSGAGGLS